MRNPVRIVGGLVALAVLLPLVRVLADSASRFDHETHDGLFTDCAVCHGVADPAAPVWPKGESCLACHDGDVASEMSWAPPESPWPTNLMFDHEFHIDEGISCEDCHGGPDIVRADATACFECHGEASHLEDANDCSECHVPLTEALAIPDSRVLAWPQPPSHAEKGFRTKGHGALATAQCPAEGDAPTSCAVCHSRNFCMTCHANGKELPEIEALGLDPQNRGSRQRSERRPAPSRRQPSPRFLSGSSPAGGGRRRRQVLPRDLLRRLRVDLHRAAGKAQPPCGSGAPVGSRTCDASRCHDAIIPGG